MIVSYDFGVRTFVTGVKNVPIIAAEVYSHFQLWMQTDVSLMLKTDNTLLISIALHKSPHFKKYNATWSYFAVDDAIYIKSNGTEHQV